ncbi:hypothetical protein AC1031_020690 [Aphanomyces cochlioides]|nr:hypothetical protein AC1031_020690 [Aphanomyces cochlioides]
MKFQATILMAAVMAGVSYSVECSTVCSKQVDYVCGTNNITYLNPCILAVDNCKSNGKITAAYVGECDPHSHDDKDSNWDWKFRHGFLQRPPNNDSDTNNDAQVFFLSVCSDDFGGHGCLGCSVRLALKQSVVIPTE